MNHRSPFSSDIPFAISEKAQRLLLAGRRFALVSLADYGGKRGAWPAAEKGRDQSTAEGRVILVVDRVIAKMSVDFLPFKQIQKQYAEQIWRRRGRETENRKEETVGVLNVPGAETGAGDFMAGVPVWHFIVGWAHVLPAPGRAQSAARVRIQLRQGARQKAKKQTAREKGIAKRQRLSLGARAERQRDSRRGWADRLDACAATLRLRFERAERVLPGTAAQLAQWSKENGMRELAGFISSQLEARAMSESMPKTDASGARGELAESSGMRAGAANPRTNRI